MNTYKKITIVLAITGFTSLNALIGMWNYEGIETGYPDPIVKNGWHTSQKNRIFNECMARLTFRDDLARAFPQRYHKMNVCNCWSDKYLDLFTWEDHLRIVSIKTKISAKEMNKWDKNIIENERDKRVWDLYFGEGQVISNVCATPEVAMKGVQKVVDDYNAKLDKEDEEEK